MTEPLDLDRISKMADLAMNLSSNIRDTVNAWLSDPKTNEVLSTSEGMMMVFQVVAYNLGYVDTVTASLGIPNDIRSSLVEQFMTMGATAGQKTIATAIADKKATLVTDPIPLISKTEFIN